MKLQGYNVKNVVMAEIDPLLGIQMQTQSIVMPKQLSFSNRNSFLSSKILTRFIVDVKKNSRPVLDGVFFLSEFAHNEQLICWKKSYRQPTAPNPSSAKRNGIFGFSRCALVVRTLRLKIVNLSCMKLHLKMNPSHSYVKLCAPNKMF